MCHSHTLATLAARQLKARYRIPYALVVHADIFERPRGTYDPWLTVLYKIVTPGAYRDADLVLAVSPHMARTAVARGARPEAVVVVPNGIDRCEIGLTETVDYGPRNAPPARIKLLYVGRFSVEKGVRVLVAAARLLKAQGVDFELRLVGHGPLERELRDTVLESGLSHEVTVAGQVNRRTLHHEYVWADMVCVPSLSEPFGVVVLEALAAGRPVLGTDAGGIPWIIQNGMTGLIVPAGSARRLADAIREMAWDPARRNRMGALAAASIFPRFSWDAIGAQVREAVGQAIKSHAVTRDSPASTRGATSSEGRGSG
jgi:glycosyltransferase involved in cell wall biosynthesis